MTETTSLDRDARRAIESDLDTTFLVEAAAGTGKTSCLVRRMVALFREGRSVTGRVATLTFTRKAASHLRTVFQASLEEAVAGEVDEPKRKRLARAVKDVDRCFIGTIHSFCARLLRERPLEAGVDPDFEELEEDEDAALRAEWWQAYAEQLVLSDSPILLQLEAAGVSLTELRTSYEALSNYPDVVPVASPVSRPDLTEVRTEVMRFLDRSRGDLPGTVPAKGWDDLQFHLGRACRLREILDLEVEANLVRMLEALDHTGNITQNRWPDASQAVTLKRDFDDLRERVVRPALRQWREYLHPFLLGVIGPAIEDLGRKRRSTGRLNYQDLLIGARDLLRDHPEVRCDLQRRFSHLLVDEFQDTDPIQAEIMLYLTGRDVEERDWRKLRPRPGALFVVGDPKQSIYRFRRADTAIYHRVKEILMESGGRILNLTSNFRSTEKVCQWVNEVFRAVFPPVGTREQAAYVPLNAERSSGDERCGVFGLEIVSSGPRTAEAVAEEDAAKIAQWIHGALSTQWPIVREEKIGKAYRDAVKPGDFLILLRTRARLPCYAKALEARSIPYEISGGRSFGESQELASLLPFLHAIADPDDPVAVVSFLRGDLWGVDDNALYHFRRGGGRFSYLAEPPPDADHRIGGALDLLRKARGWSQELPPGAAFARMFGALGVIAHVAAQSLGDTRAGNLLKALTLARRLSAKGRSFTEIVAYFSALAGDTGMEGMSVDPGRVNAVRLMNLHRAKGLEAPIVFLADPNVCSDHRPLFTITRDTEPPEGHFLIVAPRGFHQREMARPLGWDAKVAEETAFQEAEEERLLYVAATRARNMLVVSAHRRERKGGKALRIEGPWVRLWENANQPLPDPGFLEPEPSWSGPENLMDEVEAAQTDMEKRHATLIRPTYGVTQVTKISPMRGRHQPIGEGGRDGLLWGRLLHRLLESLMRNETPELVAWVDHLLLEEGLGVERRDEVLRVVDITMSSDLWQRACSAKRRFVEVPFAVAVPTGELGLPDGPPETILRGVIDLVFFDRNEWVIVDYKSDTIRDDLSDLTAIYAPQVRQYRRYWQKLTGEPAKSALFFLETGAVEWVD